MALRDESAKSFAQSLDIVDPPVVALVRWTSQFDWGPTIAQCLQDAGFNIVGAANGISAPDGIGAAQSSAFNLAYYTCFAEYSMNPTFNQTYTADQWGLQYDYDVEWLVPCLAAFGVTVSQPPTRQTFIAQGLQAGFPTWSPGSEADLAYQAKSWDENAAMIQTCPFDPPNEYMWGG